MIYVIDLGTTTDFVYRLVKKDEKKLTARASLPYVFFMIHMKCFQDESRRFTFIRNQLIPRFPNRSSKVTPNKLCQLVKAGLLAIPKNSEKKMMYNVKSNNLLMVNMFQALITEP